MHERPVWRKTHGYFSRRRVLQLPLGGTQVSISLIEGWVGLSAGEIPAHGHPPHTNRARYRVTWLMWPLSQAATLHLCSCLAKFHETKPKLDGVYRAFSSSESWRHVVVDVIVDVISSRVDERKRQSLLMLVEGERRGGSRLQLLRAGVAGLHPPRSEVPQRPRESQTVCHRNTPRDTLRYVASGRMRHAPAAVTSLWRNDRRAMCDVPYENLLTANRSYICRAAWRGRAVGTARCQSSASHAYFRRGQRLSRAARRQSRVINKCVSSIIAATNDHYHRASRTSAGRVLTATS